MKYAALLLLAASLVSCGKPEETPAPAMQPPATEPNVPAAAAPAVAPPPPTASEVLPPVQPATAGKPAIATVEPPKVAATQAAAVTAPATANPDLVHGQQIYRQACAFCHDKGVAGAPKTGDTAAWNPRLAQGVDVLLASALHGKGAMPAKGGNPSLSEADIRAAVDYLVAQSD